MDQSKFKYGQSETTYALTSRHWQTHRTQEEDLLTRNTTRSLLCLICWRRSVHVWRSQSNHTRLEPGLLPLHKVWSWDARRSVKKSFQNRMRLLPSPRIFGWTFNLSAKNSKGGKIMLVPNTRQESYEARHIIEEIAYDKLPKTRLIVVKDRFVTFCWHFKYLGSWISFSLREDHDIAKRLAAANSSMGAMSKIFNDDHIETYSKYILFRAIIWISYCGDAKAGHYGSPFSLISNFSCTEG